MIANLNDPNYWHSLYQSLVSENNLSLKEKLISEISGRITQDPYIELLRLTLLSEFCNSDEYIRLAGLAIQKQVPANIECLTAVAALGCMRALAEPRRDLFISSITNGQLPKIISILDKHAGKFVLQKLKPRIPQRISRVLIIPSFFANPKHTPSMLSVNYATILQQLGCHVLICALQELEPAQMRNYHGAGRVVNLPEVNFSSWSSHIAKETSLFIADRRFSMDERYGVAIDLILKFDPDLILSIGPYSPFASALYLVRPTLSLPTNTASFLGSSDVWLRGSNLKFTEDQLTWGQQFPLPIPVVHPYRIFPHTTGKQVVTRAQLGIKEDAVVLVTVGFRLSSEINPEWASRVCDIIVNNDQVVWVLIGDVTPLCLSNLAVEKLINLGITENPSDYLDLCDVYLNPPRMGGGFSILEAMSKACAVVSYADSDGGEKIGSTATNNDQEYFTHLHHLIKNPHQRIHEGQQLAQRFFDLYDLTQSKSSFVNACRLATQHCEERLKPIV